MLPSPSLSDASPIFLSTIATATALLALTRLEARLPELCMRVMSFAEGILDRGIRFDGGVRRRVVGLARSAAGRLHPLPDWLRFSARTTLHRTSESTGGHVSASPRCPPGRWEE